MLFLVNNDFSEVKGMVNFPCRIAKYGDMCVITTHNDHKELPRRKFDIIESRSGDSWDFSYRAPDWIMLGMGNPAHLQHSVECAFATFTDGLYCLSVRGEKIVTKPTHSVTAN